MWEDTNFLPTLWKKHNKNFLIYNFKFKVGNNINHALLQAPYTDICMDKVLKWVIVRGRDEEAL